VRETFQKLGDLGEAAKTLKKGTKGLGGFFKQTAEKKTFLTLQKVFEGFQKISRCSGNESTKQRE
jgi:ATP-dependent DNA ligase